jgi:branched-chain amino acid transport system permease protein
VPVPTEVAEPTALEPIPGAALSVESVSKRFGGLQALQDVSLTAEPGTVTAIIGPNGSGKTTLLNIICGFYRLDTGTIRLGAGALPRAAHRVARAGIARTFQTPLMPTEISVTEATQAGRYTAERASMFSAILRLPRFRRIRAADATLADRVLRIVGIARHARDEAAALPVGTRRLLEVARALVGRPRVLLLDEVASGLDEDEIDRLTVLVRAIRDAGGTVILVEHNFRLVLSLADRIHVLAQGKVIASGTPAEIESHPAVLSEYLGIRSAAVATEPIVEVGP